MSYDFEQTKKDFQTITRAGENMLKQDNRATQYPLFVIQQDVRRFVNPGEDYNERERTEDVHEYWLCDDCMKIHENGQELPPECEKCDEDAFVHYVIEQEFVISQAGVFLTEEACETHIRENHYHYRNPRSYVISAWRNPEMQAVMRQTIGIAGKEIPSHYA